MSQCCRKSLLTRSKSPQASTLRRPKCKQCALDKLDRNYRSSLIENRVPSWSSIFFCCKQAQYDVDRLPPIVITGKFPQVKAFLRLSPPTPAGREIFRRRTGPKIVNSSVHKLDRNYRSSLYGLEDKFQLIGRSRGSGRGFFWRCRTRLRCRHERAKCGIRSVV